MPVGDTSAPNIGNVHWERKRPQRRVLFHRLAPCICGFGGLRAGRGGFSEDEDDFGNGGRAPVSDDDKDEEQEVDVETADEKHLRIAKAYIDRTREAAADAVVRRRSLSFFLSPNFQFPPLL